MFKQFLETAVSSHFVKFFTLKCRQNQTNLTKRNRKKRLGNKEVGKEDRIREEVTERLSWSWTGGLIRPNQEALSINVKTREYRTGEKKKKKKVRGRMVSWKGQKKEEGGPGGIYVTLPWNILNWE